MVLTTWETRAIFDAEFSHVTGFPPSRCEEIRGHNEAYWQTGTFNPPNFIPPNPLITTNEQQSFQAFHAARSQLYSCVLPGEIIRQCVEAIRAGTLVPNARLALRHLIVDEFQDLNPLDQEFVHHFAQAGVEVLVAGDDDQSIYSFRFAAPQGIQNFTTQFPNALSHALQHCFRYGPNILTAAEALMTRFPVPNRLPKSLVSMYANSVPQVPGDVFRWRFGTAAAEAGAIALNCSRLIAAGVAPQEILILLNKFRYIGHSESLE